MDKIKYTGRWEFGCGERTSGLIEDDDIPYCSSCRIKSDYLKTEFKYCPYCGVEFGNI